MAAFRFRATAGSVLSALAISALLLTPPLALAQSHSHKHAEQHEHEHEHDHEHDEFTSPGSHVHGHATLTVVLEGSEAMVALQSAAYNIVGFEHAPKTNEQRQEVAAALEVLRQGKWFTVNPQAGCELADADANTDLNAEVSTAHSDFYANISLVCQQPARLNEMTVTLFNLVPSVEKITVQWVINGQQGAAEISLVDNVVAF
ncbi:ZrgA family zinc uptake protein [Arsukibacterium sp.]|uniref:ZrgA family zinc uptake protein n=1 Tax=Arsukibacterium sp. TaxID=1977258 RepID=UPI00299EDA42|nr:DUF2796 domain-containing protein [Arsukibacterium sp.]MDX1678191.1 DUF2796 domain-containing protein [Arsukibacterium sp.]